MYVFDEVKKEQESYNPKDYFDLSNMFAFLFFSSVYCFVTIACGIDKLMLIINSMVSLILIVIILTH